MMTEPMPNDDTLLSPSEAVEWLKVHRGETAMTVNILRQMRHRGRIQALQFGGKDGRITLYRIGDLRTADFTRQKAGRKAKGRTSDKASSQSTKIDNSSLYSSTMTTLHGEREVHNVDRRKQDSHSPCL